VSDWGTDDACNSLNETEATEWEPTVDEDPRLATDDDMDTGPAEPENYQLQTSGAKFLMSIRDGMCLSQRATDAVVQGGTGLVWTCCIIYIR
jgi:hypothetical protein